MNAAALVCMALAFFLAAAGNDQRAVTGMDLLACLLAAASLALWVLAQAADSGEEVREEVLARLDAAPDAETYRGAT